MSPKKSQEDILRERLNKRGSTHNRLIGISKEPEARETPTEIPATEEKEKEQNVSQNEMDLEKNVENHSVGENNLEETPTQPRRKRKPRSKRELEKEKFINKFTPRTFYVRPELLKRFDKLTGGIKGEKTRMINEALEEYLDTFEE